MMNRLLKHTLWILFTLLSIPTLLAQQNDWPRTLPLEQGMVTIYSPQVDEMKENVIHYRAALAYRATAGSEPVFGAAWFESPVEIDAANRIVHPSYLKLTETRFPAGTEEVQSELATAVAQQSPAWNLDFSLDELETALKSAEAESNAVQGLNTGPPLIIYKDHPALLVSMDGDPVLREIENSPLEAVINTPYPLIFDRKHYYLNVAKGIWYRADRATGPYRFDNRPPADIVAMVNAGDSGEADKEPLEPITAANAPEIVVTTEPAELIVTEGPAAFVPLVDDLLVLGNSDDDVFMQVSSQDYFIVLAGRWFRSNSLDGPWVFEPADELPAAFANIPQDSNQADSRVYVAGTEEAREAVLDAQIPQTAAVKRGEADIDVEYDGEPVYEPVDGTELVYIKNTGSTVIQSGNLFYLVENGVWYVSTTPNGPWQVSDHRPLQVDTILPTSPVYNVKHVHVYDSTPSVVYVGYTPGYTGSYVYHNTIFYGTGWYYRPWVSPHYYYPRHSTWGFNVAYNSWSGWNFGLSWGWGPFSVSYYSGGYWHRSHHWHHRHYGHWGPRGYRSRPGHHRYGHNRYASHGNRRGSYPRDGYDHNGYNRNSYDRNPNNGRRSRGHDRNDNLYRDSSQRARIADTRDNRPRTPGNRNDTTRQTRYAAATNSRQKNYMDLKKGERNRTGPVSSADLRVKANVRDVNFKANRNRLLADNNGNVYRKSGSSSNSYAAVSRSSVSAKSARNRGAKQARKQWQDLGQNGAHSTNIASNRRTAERTSRPTGSRSSRPSRSRTAVDLPRQSSSLAGNTEIRQNQVKNRNQSRPNPQRANPAKSSRKNTVPAKSTPQKSQHKSAQQRKVARSNNNSGKKSTGRRSRN